MAGRRRGRRRRARRLRRILLLGLLLGVGVVAAATALPIWLLASSPPPTTAFIALSRRADPATGQPCPEVAWQWVDRDAIAPDLARAVVLAEDQRFFQHRGFDLRSIERAMKERQRSGRVRGASTLTQQVAKNLFLWPGRSWARKGLEAWYTFWIEHSWSKQRILEVYLNVAQFGPCVFGAEAAARRFFEVPAAELAPEQAALLAAVLPNPLRLRAHNPGPYARERATEILALMEQHQGAGFLRRL